MPMISNRMEIQESGIDGAGPGEWFGKATLDGTRGPWAVAPVASEYIEKPTTRQGKRYRRVKAVHATLGNRTDDWSQLLHCISQTVKVTEFTDGGSTAGTFDLTEQIPIGAFVQRVTLVNVTGFAGDVSATIQVGDGTTVNRYNTGTPSVFATATAIDTGAVSGTAIHIIANTVRLTVTTSTDFTLAVTNGTGQLTVRVYYVN